MGPEPQFDAPWGGLLKGMTALSVVILVGVAAAGLLTGPRGTLTWQISMIGLPLAFLAGGTFFIIRGYTVETDKVRVHRLGWESHIPLMGLEEVVVDPEAMSGSIRTFGNGGMFCFAGAFRNKKLGGYRAFATDLKKSVVLRFTDRVVVVTPGDPGTFLQAIRTVTGR